MKMLKSVREFITKFFVTPPTSLRDLVIKSTYLALEDYSEWYDQQGIYLPPAYATAPSDWNEALHKMKRAFKLLYDEMNQEGELWDAKNKWDKYGEKDTQEIDDLNAQIRDGLALFGSQLFYLTDPKDGVKDGE